ncbi:MAG: sporulation protein YtfJ [Clostridia bacterium]|nr:sporulation protein YtfJ [Clostridia bacterium]MBR6604185.1 sporulation protein YtfJ [Clostridia bacterium]
MAETKISDVIATSLENLRSMVDANTVIGIPINTESGTTIIPISKISMGFASGGLDYNGKDSGGAAKQPNFGGGGGTGLSITPVGFLTVDKNGNVDMVNVGQTNSSALDQVADLLERSPEIIEKLKSVFGKKDKE